MTQDSQEQQVEQCEQLLGTPLFDDFMAMNALDMALYGHARRVLDSAARQISVTGQPRPGDATLPTR